MNYYLKINLTYHLKTISYVNWSNAIVTLTSFLLSAEPNKIRKDRSPMATFLFPLTEQTQVYFLERFESYSQTCKIQLNLCKVLHTEAFSCLKIFGGLEPH